MILEKAYIEVLDNHVPIEKKTVLANHVPCMLKPLRKAIIRRSNLENKYLNNRTPGNKEVYKKQKNIVVDFIKKEKGNRII